MTKDSTVLTEPTVTRKGARLGNPRPQGRSPEVYREFTGETQEGTIYAGEGLAFMRSLPPESGQVIFLDPPFNLGKRYGSSRRSVDSMPEADYKEWLSQVLDEAVRVLRQGGVLYMYHLPRWAMHFGAYLETRLIFRQWIAVSMKNGFVRGKRLYPAHYALLMFSKGAPSVSNRPKLAPALCRHCGQYVKDYGGYKGIIDAKGINLSDYWDDVSPVRHASRKHRSANELPTIIFDRVMQISGSPKGVYVDPFAGAGGGVIAAVKAGMAFKACDLFAANCRLICSRLEKA